MAGDRSRARTASAVVLTCALALAACSSGGDGKRASAPDTAPSTTTTPLPPVATSKVDPCALLGRIDLQRFGAVGRIVRGTSGTARMCTRSIRVPGKSKQVRHVKVQVFVNGSTSVQEFRKRVRRNFAGSTCTVKAVAVGAAAFVETCHGQGTGMDFSVRNAHLGLLITGPAKRPQVAIVELARAAEKRVNALGR